MFLPRAPFPTVFGMLLRVGERTTLVSQCGGKSVFINLTHSSWSVLKGREKRKEFMKIGLVV